MKSPIIAKSEYSKQDIVALLKLTEQKDLQSLYGLADSVRAKNVGDVVHLIGVIDFSNFCAKNCLYCGLRRGNEKVLRYRMDEKEIIDNAKRAEKLGYKAIVLQSGEDYFYAADKLINIIKSIKGSTQLELILAIGERSGNGIREL
ncbi:MAG: hypothetical protein MZV70_76775 [Desulfobacterales bacterium]|nr:hypothetical protein [Desulfobacterales bacterium]